MHTPPGTFGPHLKRWLETQKENPVMSRYSSAWQSGLNASREDGRNRPTVVDFDDGEIAVRLNGKQLRSWIYNDDTERRLKMVAAREYVEGYCDGRGERTIGG